MPRMKATVVRGRLPAEVVQLTHRNRAQANMGCCGTSQAPNGRPTIELEVFQLAWPHLGRTTTVSTGMGRQRVGVTQSTEQMVDRRPGLGGRAG
jgi:hypothetical protein